MPKPIGWSALREIDQMVDELGSDPLQGHVDGRLIRGGTSKGFFVRRSALPAVDEDLLDELVLELYGTPDPLQVDGIGGSHSHTSKLMIVESSDRPDVDIEYTFGQVAITNPVVDWGGNCGNLTSAIGVFAIKDGLIDVDGDQASLTLYNTNTDTVIKQTIPLDTGTPDVYGDYTIDGVPGTGARIDSRFLDPAGGVFGSLFPTGNVLDDVTVDGESIEYSVSDVTNPCVYVRATDLGLSGTELPEELAADPELIDRFERIRGSVCEHLGLVDDAADAVDESPTIPFIAAVSSPQDYETSIGTTVAASDIDITARVLTTQRPHHAYAMTGAMGLAATAQLPGTIPNDVTQAGANPIRIGHPKGIIEVGVTADDDHVESVTVGRTAREIMRGRLFYRYVGNLETLR